MSNNKQMGEERKMGQWNREGRPNGRRYKEVLGGRISTNEKMISEL